MRSKKYRSEVIELQRGRRRAFREEEPVSLPAELASKPSGQTILQVKDPQDLPEDLVYCLMEGGRPLTILEDIRPIFRTFTSVSGHVSGTHQSESYYRPTFIRKQRAAALRPLNDDVMRGGCLGVVFDETTNGCDRHPVNIIVHTCECVCYTTTTAFIGRKEAVNCNTVAKAVMDAWDQMVLPRDRVGVVLVDSFKGFCTLLGSTMYYLLSFCVLLLSLVRLFVSFCFSKFLSMVLTRAENFLRPDGMGNK